MIEMLQPFPQWYVPPLPQQPSRAERRQYAAETSWAKNRIRWIWVRACSGTDLARWITVADRLTPDSPRLGPITLGQPTRLSVELLPGQRPQDIVDVAENLAAAYGVADVRVVGLVPGWVTVELPVGHAALAESREGPVGQAEPGPPAAADSSATQLRSHARRGRWHFGRRGTRGPAGGPRSLR